MNYKPDYLLRAEKAQAETAAKFKAKKQKAVADEKPLPEPGADVLAATDMVRKATAAAEAGISDADLQALAGKKPAEEKKPAKKKK
ncbi:MAG: hypothetical protein GWN94_18770 [Phycisphaerae bacterium]|nr:hypothetical protein [Phycisphaerae bacterium]